MKQFRLLWVFSLAAIMACDSSSDSSVRLFLEDSSLRDQQEITVHGYAATFMKACDDVECPESDPCCQGCFSDIGLADFEAGLHDDSQKIRLKPGPGLPSFECRGQSCSMDCEPLEYGVGYKITGIWHEENGTPWTYYIEVTEFEKLF